MGSGHWHPSMSTRETDSDSGIPGSHRVSVPTSDGKGEMRRLGGDETYLWVFGKPTDMVEPQNSLLSLSAESISLPGPTLYKGFMLGPNDDWVMEVMKQRIQWLSLIYPLHCTAEIWQRSRLCYRLFCQIA